VSPFLGQVHPDRPSAANAMHSMNGVQLGSKQVIVRLHEPKQLRQEKLAQRFANTSHPRSSSGATSPTLSEGAESFGGWPSPGRTFSAGSVTLTSDRPRRSSGSYYHVSVFKNRRPDQLLMYSRPPCLEILTCLCNTMIWQLSRLSSEGRSLLASSVVV
jgi:hypothetical protein